ncbi:molybdopterin-dependent oxidoreductase [Solirubrobacter soli]|uniref:molybdopterin-dependent oxidoreductase n=1 Tax=Solirubrobacter soli TaxID=363832 RepID=UPI00041F1038|nr:molybdopterin-dependent oxidoreductase [Solirubrobacter soli]
MTRRAVRRRRAAIAPPGPFRPAFWRSPLRGPWLTSALGSILLVLIAIVATTGFLSHAAYMPDLGRNAIVPKGRDLPLLFNWPTSPSWLYGLTQGLHTNVGLIAIPFLLAKLWSVIPRLFVFPRPSELIERLSIALLVSSAVFELATGVMNAQYWYPFKFNFVVAHYYGAIVFVASLALHVIVKLPVIRKAYRERGVLKPLRDDLAHTKPEPTGDLVTPNPAAPTISRRGLFAFAGAGAATLLVANAGQSIGGPLRKVAFLAPRREDFPINKRAAQAGVTEAMTGDTYRLVLTVGDTEVELSRDDLLALPQRTATLPIACVEGWTTKQEWTGVQLKLLAAKAGAPGASQVLVESLQPKGVLRQATLSGGQIAADDALLALKVNGEDLSMDHGFPARIIVPALPGVHNTKWVGRMTFA